MPQPLANYSQTTADWRKTIRINSYRTYFVIATFLIIYASIGLLVDTYLQAAYYPRATLEQIFLALITGRLPPVATLISLSIAGITIFLTFAFHDKLMLLGTEYREITEHTAQSLLETQLYNVVAEMRIAAGLRYMPKVFLIEANYMNAFASGYSEKSALVAITRGLIAKLDRDELQAVMAHELSHIRHMDIKLTLVAAVLSNFILMLIDMLFYTALYARDDRENRSRSQLFTIIMILRYVLPFINMLLILYLSRSREYMADAGSVELTRTNEPLARALLKIYQDHQQNQDVYTAAYQHTAHENVRREAYIFDPVQAGITSFASASDLFSTHPDINKRLAALGFKAQNSR